MLNSAIHDSGSSESAQCSWSLSSLRTTCCKARFLEDRFPCRNNSPMATNAKQLVQIMCIFGISLLPNSFEPSKTFTKDPTTRKIANTRCCIFHLLRLWLSWDGRKRPLIICKVKTHNKAMPKACRSAQFRHFHTQVLQ